MSEDVNKNTDQQPTTQPADNGTPGNGKMFTQDDVNRIVSERLARDREVRTAQQQADANELVLKAREARLDCREYLSEMKYPTELLEVLDTSDVNKFKAAADKIQEMYGWGKPARFAQIPRFDDSGPVGSAPPT